LKARVDVGNNFLQLSDMLNFDENKTPGIIIILDWGPVPHFCPWRHCNQCG
jgi:hypothetical protein